MNRLIYFAVIILFFVFLVLLVYHYKCKFLKDCWKLEYLQKIYPLGTNLTVSQYDKLDCLFSDLLPNSEKAALTKIAYTAALPGPSCWQLPCPCDKDNIPNVAFAPNPILQNKWPPCNVPGPNGNECCASVAAYKQCFKDNKIPWSISDTWTGNLANKQQGPPKIGQVWKPALWPKYSLAVSSYPETDWNSFYNAKGDPDNAWIEGLHSSFSIQNKTLGVWFYRVKGSGMFVNLGRTFAGLNKIDVIVKLWEKLGSLDGYKSLEDYINHEKLQDVIDVGPNNTGLGGTQNLDYWSNGQIHTNLQELMNEYPNVSITDMLKKVVESKGGLTEYELNRVSNTGALDHLIVYLAKQNGYESVQFTVQSNLYTGWTTEIMILGPDKTIYTDISQIPKTQFRVLDPNNLPKDKDSDKGKPCEFGKMFSCVSCDAVPATISKAMNCTEDISKWEDSCKKSDPSKQHGFHVDPNDPRFKPIGGVPKGVTWI